MRIHLKAAFKAVDLVFVVCMHIVTQQLSQYCHTRKRKKYWINSSSLPDLNRNKLRRSALRIQIFLLLTTDVLLYKTPLIVPDSFDFIPDSGADQIEAPNAGYDVDSNTKYQAGRNCFSSHNAVIQGCVC